MIFAVVNNDPETGLPRYTGTIYRELDEEILKHHKLSGDSLAAITELDDLLQAPQQSALENLVRKVRDMRLAECDWIVVRATELGESVPEQWKNYRQRLRDITSQESFPEVTWPEKPQ